MVMQGLCHVMDSHVRPKILDLPLCAIMLYDSQKIMRNTGHEWLIGTLRDVIQAGLREFVRGNN
jgi:hypothetical protein